MTDPIADLVARAGALLAKYEANQANWDAARAALAAQTPAMRRLIYINQQLGDDLNDGALNAPVRTMTRAVALIPDCGLGQIYLQADYNFGQEQVTIKNGKALYIVSDNPAVRRRVDTAAWIDGANALQLGGFMLTDVTAGVVMQWRNLTLALPPAPGGAPTTQYAGLISAWQSDGAASLSCAFSACVFEVPATPAGYVFARGNRALIFTLSGGSTYPGAIAGRWVHNVAAGATATAVDRVITNLTTL